MSYKTVPDVDDGCGDRTPACREYTLPRADSDSRIYAPIPGQTVIGPVLQVHIIQCLGLDGIEIQIPSTKTQNRTSWVAICRAHLNPFGNNPDEKEPFDDLSKPRKVHYYSEWKIVGTLLDQLSPAQRRRPTILAN